MQGKTFQRRIEDFTCEHCGAFVKGNGYTNHCPACLWSKHVDVAPGDRAASCAGLMEPVRVEGASPDYAIVHRCATCGFEGRNAVGPGDDPEAVIAIAKNR